MIHLRPYQDAAVEKIKDAYRRKKRRVVYVLPCGGGKTIVFTVIGQGASRKQKRVTAAAHRRELIKQISNKLTAFDVDHGIIKSGYPEEYEKNIQVASIQTLYQREDVPAPNMFIYDECHHSISPSAQEILARYPDAILLGVTASPIDLGKFYDEMIVGPSVRELIDDGYLVPYRVFAPAPVAVLRGVDYDNLDQVETAMNKRVVTGNAIDHYKRIADALPAIVYTVRIKHTLEVAEQFQQAGYGFFAVDGTMKEGQRKEIFDNYNSGKIQGIVSCDIVNEGTDLPRATVGIQLRPYRSQILAIQQPGRLSRPFYADGMPLDTAEQRRAAIASSVKPCSYLLDCVDNVSIFGLPDDLIEWSLTMPPKNLSRQGQSGIMQCKQCDAVFPPAQKCPYCGYDPPVQERKLKYTEGELVEMTRAAVAERKKAAEDERLRLRREIGMAKTMADLVAIEKQRGYKKGWAAMTYAAKKRKKK
jgi:superfamily II DNA or RNA helicase